MLRFVIRKMFSKKWMVLSLLIGNILLISITAGNPMYTRAMLQRTLTKSLEARLVNENVHPGLITMRSNKNTKTLEKLRAFDDAVQGLPERYGVPAVEEVRIFNTRETKGVLDLDRGTTPSMSLCSMSDLGDHIDMIAGDFYDEPVSQDGVINAVVSERAMVNQELMLDDVLTLPNMTDADGNPLRVRVAGVFRNSRGDDPYWVRTPAAYSNRLLSTRVCLKKCSFSRRR